MTEVNSRRNHKLLVLVVFAGFLVFGFMENIKGPALPRMQSDFNLNEMQLGLPFFQCFRHYSPDFQ